MLAGNRRPVLRGAVILASFMLSSCTQFDGELRAQTRRAPAVRPKPSTKDFVASSYELGRESVKLEQKQAELDAEIGRAKAETEELEMVVVFSECIASKSGLPHKEAFERGKFNEVCRTETMRKTPEEIRVEAAKIIAAKKAE